MKLLEEMDWALLREQKSSLRKSIEWGEIAARMEHIPYYGIRAKHLTGVFAILSALQDAAVESGISEAIVFGDGDNANTVDV